MKLLVHRVHYMYRVGNTELSLEFSEDVGVGAIWEELLTTSKLLCSTYLMIKGICSLKALKFREHCNIHNIHMYMHMYMYMHMLVF